MIEQLEIALHNKTRVALYTSGAGDLTLDILLHSLKSVGKSVDIIANGAIQTSDHNQFVIINITEDWDIPPNFQSNIALVCIKYSTNENTIIESMVAGGVLILPQDSDTFDNALNSTTKFFRRIEFPEPIVEKLGNSINLNTDMGLIPIVIPEDVIKNIDGIRLVAQQLGVMEDEFYESLISYRPIF